MSSLVPCVSCNRHIKVEHEACPFCNAAVPAGFARRAIPGTTRRLDRLALFTFAATLTVAACGGMDDGSARDDHGMGADSGASQPGYGGPIEVLDASRADARSTRDANGAPDATRVVSDSGGPAPMYGIPWPDDAGPSDEPDGGWAPPYGLPLFDAGTFDE